MAEGIPGHPVTLYPLTAVVGNRDAVDAVSCVLCRGNIRTVLLIGPPGSGKTVVARAAGSVSGDRRIVEVPLNVTAEQAFGTIDLEEAVSSGRRRVSDSLMRRADGNILIADNANLLPKSILHGILDAVLTGRVMAELDGTSVSEDCDTVLVATMDPSEAELSRHELDRFDICVRMEPIDGMDGRLEVLRRSLMHSRDPAGFRSLYEDSEEELRGRISAADPLSVRLPDWAVPAIQGACAAMGADGHRGDISIAETAVTLAALRGLGEADLQCVRDAIRLCLPHRSRHDAGTVHIRRPHRHFLPETAAQCLCLPAAGHDWRTDCIRTGQRSVHGAGQRSLWLSDVPHRQLCHSASGYSHSDYRDSPAGTGFAESRFSDPGLTERTSYGYSIHPCIF